MGMNTTKLACPTRERLFPALVFFEMLFEFAASLIKKLATLFDVIGSKLVFGPSRR